MHEAKTPASQPDRTAVVTLDEILAAFRSNQLRPVKTSGVYKLGLLLVAVMMILLPLVYLGLVFFVGWATWYHATHNSDLFGEGRGGFFTYLTPLVVGVIALFFLIKPIFARSGKPPAAMTLERGREPALEAFVQKICQTVGAPLPKQIEIDCNVNAAAGMRRGFWSLFGRDLKLVIGLPLVAGMDLRSFGGILAHEFGHFAQGAGMRLTYIIRTVNAWFARVVYERDAWDQRLDDWARNSDLRIMIVLQVARGFIWLSRRILWVLMHAGHAISCFAMRQMEYDADTYEVRFAGSETFAKTSRRLQLLNAGAGQAQGLLQEAWQDGRLGRNLPAFCVSRTQALPQEAHEAIDKGIAEGKTGWFSTHPSDKDRIAAALRLDDPGIFALEAPASSLFRDFDRLSEQVTLHFYSKQLELNVTEENLVDNAVLEGEDQERQAAYDACDRYFFECLSLQTPISVTWHEVFTSPVAESACRSREELCELAAARKADFEEIGRLMERQNQLWAAQALLRAGFRIRPADFEVSASSLAAVNEALLATESDIPTVTSRILRLHDALKTRLRHDLRTACDNDPEEAGKQTRELLNLLIILQPLLPTLKQLRQTVLSQQVLINNLSDDNSEGLINHMRQLEATEAGALEKLRNGLGDTPYPFDHARGRVNIQDTFKSSAPPTVDNLFRVHDSAEKALQQVARLYFWTMGRLAQIAEAANTAGATEQAEPDNGRAQVGAPAA